MENLFQDTRRLLRPKHLRLWATCPELQLRTLGDVCTAVSSSADKASAHIRMPVVSPVALQCLRASQGSEPIAENAKRYFASGARSFTPHFARRRKVAKFLWGLFANAPIKKACRNIRTGLRGSFSFSRTTRTTSYTIAIVQELSTRAKLLDHRQPAWLLLPCLLLR